MNEIDEVKESINIEEILSNDLNLTVAETSGDLVIKQIYHKILKNYIIKNELFFVFNKQYRLKNNNLENFLLDEFSKLGKLFRMQTASDYSENYFLCKNYIIKFDVLKHELDSKYKPYDYINFRIYIKEKSQKTILELLLNKILSNYMDINISIDALFHYITSHDNCLRYANFNVIYDINIPQVNYPYIKNIRKYIDDYFNNKSPILILMGEPGTGKTRFIRYLTSLLKYKYNYNWNLYYTVDPEVIKRNEFFISYMSSNSKLMVIEDMDKNLQARVEGNEVMYSLLNISDGIIDIKDKKMIFSTNLPSIRNIDEALIRKGRCYDILEFKKLTKEESLDFLKENKKENLNLENNSYTLADLYALINNNLNNCHKKKEIGFKNE